MELIRKNICGIDIDFNPSYFNELSNTVVIMRETKNKGLEVTLRDNSVVHLYNISLEQMATIIKWGNESDIYMELVFLIKHKYTKSKHWEKESDNYTFINN